MPATHESGPSPLGQPPLLRMSGITKYFKEMPACEDVDFDVAPGEVHGLLGQNGAGKSTLMNVLLGLVRSDRGSIELAGEPVVIRSPNEARAHGIGMVHQHYSLIPTLSVWENIAVTTKGRIRRDALAKAIAETSASYGLEVSPDRRVDELTVGEQQRVEIVKCLIERPRLLVLDEPTAVLTEQESRALFAMLGQVVAGGTSSVVLISHNLAEIRAVADRATIMRSARVASRVIPRETSVAELARQMIGRDLVRTEEVASAIGAGPCLAPDSAASSAPRAPRPVLEIEGARAALADGRSALDGLDLSVCPGEILGVAGVEGNGQKWLSTLLAGSLALRAGRVTVGGKEVRANRPGAMRSSGISVVPEDRRESGCILDMSVADNIALGSLGALARRGVVSRRQVRKLAERLIVEFDISVAAIDQPMRSLSGGNQQKIVLARELSARPSVLVLAQPTRGLDVGAVEYIYQRVRMAAADGMAVIVISTDLGEILRLSNRIAVMYRGRVRGEMARDEADAERIGLLMGGVAA